MRAPISVIVPTLNAEGHLGTCLMSLMPALERGLIRELIVSDGGSTDQTVALAKEWGAEVLEGTPSRGAQLARACRMAQGRWLLVLHADTRLDDSWVGAAIRHIETQKAGWFMLAFDDGGLAAWCVASWANLRSRLGLPYGDQGLLLPKALYDQVGGYPQEPLMEDVALAMALKGHLRALPANAITSAVRYQRQGWLRRGARNLWTLCRYFGGASPQTLADSYRS
ncbi:MAG: TIGR04283 family arsenosugar biosynthesis glycosyltransferase [Pseudomonadota bacterium]